MSLNLLLVTFALRDPNWDYSKFWVAVRGNSVNWLHYIEQTVLVTTPLTADAYAKAVVPYIRNTDSLIVAPIDARLCQGWLPKAAWEWMNQISDTARLLPPRS